MTDDKPVDPRYDPAFQRGFDGEVATGTRQRTAARRTAVVAPAPYREAPDAVPEDEPISGVVEASTTRSAAPARDDDTVERVSADAYEHATQLRRTARNPFHIGLAVVATVLIIGGVAALNKLYATVSATGGAGSDTDYWVYQTVLIAGPLAIALGVAIWSTLLFLLARAWQRG
ncbi:hypothetical protein BH11ACT3_BH11ACT3_18570 [soil metagenome]